MASSDMGPPPRPPWLKEPRPENLFSSELLFEGFAGAGVRKTHTICLRCLKTCDEEHRIRYLECKDTCILCNSKRHFGKACSRMERYYAEFFTPQWLHDHCDLNGEVLWTEEGVERYKLARDHRLKKARKPQTAQAPSVAASSKAPKKDSRPDNRPSSRSRPSGQRDSSQSSRGYASTSHHSRGDSYRTRDDDYYRRSRSPPRARYYVGRYGYLYQDRDRSRTPDRGRRSSRSQRRSRSPARSPPAKTEESAASTGSNQRGVSSHPGLSFMRNHLRHSKQLSEARELAEAAGVGKGQGKGKERALESGDGDVDMMDSSMAGSSGLAGRSSGPQRSPAVQQEIDNLRRALELMQQRNYALSNANANAAEPGARQSIGPERGTHVEDDLIIYSDEEDGGVLLPEKSGGSGG